MKNVSRTLPKNTSVLFATFSRWIGGRRMPTNGSVEPLRDFLVPRIKKLVIIDQPVPTSEEVLPKYEEYTQANLRFVPHKPPFLLTLLRPLLFRFNSNNTQVVFKIRDFFSVIFWGMSDKTTFDYLIGLESINTLAGIILRKLRKGKKVINYVSDYSPSRYPTQWFNSLYLWLDRYCAMHADYIWDVSKAVQKARLAGGLDSRKSAPVIHVPNGLYPDQIRVNMLSGIDRYALAYMGTVGKENGPDVAIRTLALVRKKFPKATLHIVGGSRDDFA